ncbi:hypothetical protein [Leptolyngbya ohadii]|uniref:hypothetical protein n=1 Tax=Leptolyngbya ohadii TaxID=1962290 RepID=UPI00117A2A89|nr:hypothetical protein [Leptolyngbya ohadii]
MYIITVPILFLSPVLPAKEVESRPGVYPPEERSNSAIVHPVSLIKLPLPIEDKLCRRSLI